MPRLARTGAQPFALTRSSRRRATSSSARSLSVDVQTVRVRFRMGLTAPPAPAGPR